MGDDIRIPAEYVLYSRGRQHGIFVIAATRTITDPNPKSRDDSSIAYNTLNGSNSFIERVEERLCISKANLSKFKSWIYLYKFSL